MFCAPSEDVVEDFPIIGGPDSLPVLASAVVTFQPNTGFEDISGSFVFEQIPTGTRMFGQVTGLSPGKHGTHVHTLGDLREGCGSTGGHYNPLGQEFEDGNAGGYIGNLGNIFADDNGVADVDRFYENLPLSGPNSVLARSIVIHANPNGGPRAACGAIGLLE